MWLRSRLGRWWITFAALVCVTGSASVALGQTEPPVDDKRQSPPELTGEDKSRVEELEKQIAALREQGKYANAIPLAKEALRIRRRVQGEHHWETDSARRWIETLQYSAKLPRDAQMELANAYRADAQISPLYGQGKHAEALRIARGQLEARTRLLGNVHPHTIASRAWVGLLLKAQGKLSEAEPVLRRAVADYGRVLGEKHPHTLVSMNNLALLFQAKGAFSDAKLLYERTLDTRRAVLGSDHPDTLNSMSNLGQLLHAMGDHDAAEPLLRQALEKRRDVLGGDDPAVASSMINLAGLLHDKGDYPAAEPLYREALASNRRLYGEEHPEVATALNNLASMLQDQGKYAEAESLYREALQIRRKLFGAAHPDIAVSLCNVANILYVRGDYGAAVARLREALAMARRIYGDEHPDVAHTLNGLAVVLYAKGEYGAAEPLYREALIIQRKLLGNQHMQVATTLNNLAVLLYAKGDYSAAEPLYREALAMRRQILGDTHPDVARSLGTLAVLLKAKGDYAGAEPLYRQAMTIRRALLGDGHPDVARSVTNLAVLLQAKGDYARAEPLLREALAIRRTAFGNEHAEVANSLNNLGALLHQQNNDRQAEALLRDALAIRRKLLGDEHPDVAISLCNVAEPLRDRGEYPSAESLLREALPIRLTLLGVHHPLSVSVIDDLATVRHCRGDFAEAQKLWEQAAEGFEIARIRLGTMGLERAHFGAELGVLPSLAVCHARSGEPHPAWRRLECNLARGLLDALSARHVRPLDSGEQQREGNLIGQLSKLDERISALEENVASDEARKLAGDLRKERSGLMAEFVCFQKEMEDKHGVAAGEVYDLDRIRKWLLVDAALLAWVDLEGSPHAVDPNGEHWACLVRHEGEPIWAKLPGSGEDGAWTEEDNTLPKRVQEALAQRPSAGSPELQELLSQLHAQRIAPLEGHLSGIRHLVVLPAGWMAGMPVEALTDNYTISYAPSATMYAWLREQSGEAAKRRSHEGMGKLLALGDPVFRPAEAPSMAALVPPDHGVLLAMVGPDSNAARSGLKAGDVLLSYGDEELSGPEDLVPAIQHATEGETTRGGEAIPVKVWRDGETLDLSIAPGKMGVRPDQQPAPEAIRAKRQLDKALAATRGATFAPLPGTRREIEGIAKLTEAAGEQVEAMILLGPDASEERLDRLATSGELKKFRFLHLATHGVMDDQVAMRSALVLSQDSAMDDRKAFERVLAGKEVYDGRLTAEQIVRTWKLDADLVTLSACETALGKQAGGEGFLGFSQALFVAGARNLVLSLWKVGDVSTSILMEELYRNVLVREMPLAEALREAKLTLRNMTRAEVERRLKAIGIADWSGSVRSRAGKAQVLKPTDRPFEDPYYWAPFILIGAG